MEELGREEGGGGRIFEVTVKQAVKCCLGPGGRLDLARPVQAVQLFTHERRSHLAAGEGNLGPGAGSRSHPPKGRAERLWLLVTATGPPNVPLQVRGTSPSRVRAKAQSQTRAGAGAGAAPGAAGAGLQTRLLSESLVRDGRRGPLAPERWACVCVCVAYRKWMQNPGLSASSRLPLALFQG